jgi:hypothetical protein
MPRVSATRFVALPTDLLFQLAEHKNIGWVYMMLHHHGHGAESGAWASISTLAAECHMKPKAVKESLRWLVVNGWVVRVSRPGFTSCYHVRLDRPQVGDKTEQTCPDGTQDPDGTQGPKGPQGVGPKRALGGGAHMGPTNKNPRTRTQEPKPIKKEAAMVEPPQTAPDGGTIASGPSASKAKGSRTTTAKENRDPLGLRRLPDEAVPFDLLDCQQLLAEFWQHKKGTRSSQVFTRICNKLRKWTPDGRRESLETAIANGYGDVFPPRAPQRQGYGHSRHKPLDQLGAEMSAMPSLF